MIETSFAVARPCPITKTNKLDINEIRLINDGPARGGWNMAVDQAILESVNETGLPVLRIYRWSPATLSLGYFQSHDDRQLHPESRRCDLVRRSSGGGAIIHDREITYSLTLPSTNRWAEQNTQIYRIVHDSITGAMAQYDVHTYPFDSSIHQPPQSPNSFLCFRRRSDGDLICDGYKVVGSAQRRSKQAVLQHGSILLETSEFAPQLPGIQNLTNKKIDAAHFTNRFVTSLCENLKFTANPCSLSDREQEIANKYLAKRFDNDIWNIHRKKTTI